MRSPEHPRHRQLYTDADFNELGFHDCYVFGVRWDIKSFAFFIDLNYIVEWVEPNEHCANYRFWVAKASVKFKNVEDVQLRFDWSGLTPICQIEELRRSESRSTPNGLTQWRWEMNFSTPEGELALWSTGFDLTIASGAVLSDNQGPSQDFLEG